MISGVSMSGSRFFARHLSMRGPSTKEVKNDAVANPINPLAKMVIDQFFVSNIET